jgi:hypothetical protein
LDKERYYDGKFRCYQYNDLYVDGNSVIHTNSSGGIEYIGHKSWGEERIDMKWEVTNQDKKTTYKPYYVHPILKPSHWKNGVLFISGERRHRIGIVRLSPPAAEDLLDLEYNNWSTLNTYYCVYPYLVCVTTQRVECVDMVQCKMVYSLLETERPFIKAVLSQDGAYVRLRSDGIY